MNTLVSIIIPVYNSERYLAKCIESIQRQSYTNIEIILVDDKSCDNTISICKSYEKSDKRVKLICLEINSGSIAARKQGVQNSCGKYVMFVDADDWIDKDMVRFFVDKMKNGYDFISTGLFYEGLKTKKRIYQLQDKEFLGEFEREIYIRSMLLSGNKMYDVCPSSCAKFYKRDFILKCLSYVPLNVRYGEDAITTLICVLNAERFCCFREIFYHYYQRNDSKQHTLQTEDIYSVLWHMCTMINILNENKKPLSIQDRNRYLVRRMLESMKIFLKESIDFPLYFYNSITDLHGKKIVLYGAGEVGRGYYGQIVKYCDCNIVHWVDKSYKNIHCKWREIEPVELLKKGDYDIVLIAVKSSDLAKNISLELQSIGIQKGKIFWERPRELLDNL